MNRTAFRAFALSASLMPFLASAVPAQSLAGWSVTPAEVAPDKPFDLKLVNARYAGCGAEFNLQEATLNGRNLELYYRVGKIAAPCSTAAAPTGPAFHVPALKPGAYPVYYHDFPACYPDCHAISTPYGPVDTLTVSASTGLSRHKARAVRTNPVAKSGVRMDGRKMPRP